MKPQGLTLDSEIFDEFRVQLNAAIRATISQAVETRTNGGTITAKIDFKLNGFTGKETGEIFYNPEFDSKTSAKIGKKSELNSKKASGFCMVEDGRGGYIIASRQIDIADILTEGERK